MTLWLIAAHLSLKGDRPQSREKYSEQSVYFIARAIIVDTIRFNADFSVHHHEDKHNG